MGMTQYSYSYTFSWPARLGNGNTARNGSGDLFLKLIRRHREHSCECGNLLYVFVPDLGTFVGPF